MKIASYSGTKGDLRTLPSNPIAHYPLLKSLIDRRQFGIFCYIIKNIYVE